MNFGDSTTAPMRSMTRGSRYMIRDLGASGVTVLVSSHILAEIEQVSDSVTIVRRGRLIASGLVSDVVGGSAASSLRVRVADLAAAQRILAEHAMTSTRVEDHLMVEGAADGSQVTQLLAEHALYVSELTPVQPDLESVFLDLTRDEVTGP
jgi:ABC-2 type transport system ATP-binding protein